MRTREIYWRLTTAFSDFSSYLANKIKPFYCPLQQKRNHGIYAINIHAKIGFFAQLNQCLRVFAYCEQHNLKPIISLTSPFYVRAKGENWLEYFFEVRELDENDKKLVGNGSIKISHVSDIDQLGLPEMHDLRMNLEYANQLLWSYLTIKSELMEYVDSYAERQFSNKTVLGIHYRGTDKKSEAKPVTRKFVAATISNYIDANPHVDTLFVASDEGDFIEWIGQEFKHIDVLSHDDTIRSKNGIAIHVQPALGDNYIKGKEALVNSLLLAKCDALIRTSSFLSAWSSIFNPSLPVIMLNRPFDDKLWFPDALIAQKSLNEYLPNKIWSGMEGR